MGLVNVEKVEAQEQHEKSWFKRHFPKLAAATAATGALVVSTSSMAFIEAADVTSATSGAGGEAVLKINLQYENKENCKRGFDPIVRNVYLQNVTCEKSKFGTYIVGLEDNDHVYNINVEDCHFNNVAQGNSIKGAKDITFKGLYINGKEINK